MRIQLNQKEALALQGILESLRWEEYTLTKTIPNAHIMVQVRTPPDPVYYLNMGNTDVRLCHLISLLSALEAARLEVNKEVT